MDRKGSGTIRRRGARLRGDAGFTLIELLAIIIIGILAAIAIQLFLSQRTAVHDAVASADLHQLAQEEEVYLSQRTVVYDATARSDLHNFAIAEETALNQTGTYVNTVPALYAQGFTWSSNGGLATGSGTNGTLATGATIVVYDATGATVASPGTSTPAVGGYCAVAAPPSGNVWVYESWNGGLQPLNSVTACPATFTPAGT